MNNFYLLGMPRCRSLWLSHLLSFGNSYCFHEALSHRQDLMERRIPKIYGYENVGSADTYPFAFNENLVGESPLVLIDRPLDEIKNSLVNSFDYTIELDQNRVLDEMYEHFQTIVSPNYMRVSFDSLRDPQVVLKVMEFCGVRIDNHHINKMLCSKIVVTNNNIIDSNHGLLDHLE